MNSTTDTSAYQIISSPNNYQACRTVHLRPKALQNNEGQVHNLNLGSSEVVAMATTTQVC